MVKLDVVNLSNEVVGSVDVQDSVLTAEVKPALIHEVVVMQLACKRAGTHSTKTRAMVRGGGRKPWKQKGTGRARSGSTRSPIWRGGGVIFGPMPRDYSYTMPRKKVKAALKSILSAKHAEGLISVIDKFDIKEGKTKEAVEALKKLNADRSVLFIVDDVDEKVTRAFRNIPYVDFLHVKGLNVYDVVNARRIFILKSCLEQIEKTLTVGNRKTA
jgi:large subunit ribosomal protein L4